MTVAVVGLGVALAACGSARIPELPSVASTAATSHPPSLAGDPDHSTASRRADDSPPLSQIPPPTMTQPAASPKTPSDAFFPLTLTGAASEQPRRAAPLSTPAGSVRAGRPRWRSALAHPRVTVVAMPHPEIASPCDVATMEVQS